MKNRIKIFDLSMLYIQELKYRILYTLWGICLSFLICYLNKQTLIYLLIPAGVFRFLSTEITEIFATYLKICTACSFLIGICVSFIQFYLFLRPGLYKYEAKIGLKFLYVTFYYYLIICTKIFPLVIQFSWDFFITYTQNFKVIELIFEPQIEKYLSFMYAIGLVSSFSYPVAIIISINIAYTKTEVLTNYRRIIYIITFILSAILTPPDIITQMIITLPIIIFYEIQIVIWIIYKTYKNLLINFNLEAN